MKKLLLLLALCMFSCSILESFAQTWFPIGAKWTYNIIFPGSPDTGIKTVYCKGDTLINGINAKILIGGNTICSWVLQNENYLYYDEKDEIVYMYWSDEFKSLIDFSKKEGETYYSYYYDFNNNTGELELYAHLCTVDSVKITYINDYPIRQQFFRSDNNLYGGYNGAVTEFIINFHSFYPENSATCDMEQSYGLRCFESPTLKYYAKPQYEIYGCNYNINIHENTQSLSINVFPNPVEDILTIQIEEDNVLLPMLYILFDVFGNQITKGEIVNPYSLINLSSIPRGYYFLKLKNVAISETIYKLIKI
jgi:hypothetical protein